ALPIYVQPGIDRPVFAGRAGRTLAFGQTAIVRAGRNPGLRQPVATRTAQRRAGLGDVGDGYANVGIGLQRIGDETVEHGIVIETPPVRRDRIETDGGAIRRNERAGRGRRRRRLRRLIVGANRAGSERQHRRGGEGGAEYHRLFSYSAGTGASAPWPPVPPRRCANHSPSARQTT